MLRRFLTGSLLLIMVLLCEGAFAAQQEAGITFSHPSGCYMDEFVLELSCNEAGAKILYTLDGSDPLSSKSALLYTQPFLIASRANDENHLSAIPAVTFSAAYNQPNAAKDGFDCDVPLPGKESVDKCTVLRAAGLLPDGTPIKERNAVYFIGSITEHIPGLSAYLKAGEEDLMVFCITMDEADLFDEENGIYTKGRLFDEALQAFLSSHRLRDGETARSLNANYKQRGRAWERICAMTVLSVSPEKTTAVLSQNCGIRIQGNYSRSDMQKGFRLYARNDYGDNTFSYPLFADDCLDANGNTLDRFHSIVLRAGGNSAFFAKFNDAFWQSLAKGLSVSTQCTRPCLVYLNGEYWGLYILEEDYSDHYFAAHYGVNKEDVVLYKGDAEAYACGYKLDLGTLPEDTTDEAYFLSDLLAFFNTHSSLFSMQDYQAFCKLVDPDGVMDYFAYEIYINNKWDWPGKNWSMWKTTAVDPEAPMADGRWRFVLYDLDFGGVSGISDAYADTVRDDNYKPHGLLDTDTSNPAVLCFALCMTNLSFRYRFYEKLTSLSETQLEKEHALAVLSQFEALYTPLYDSFFARYPGIGSTADAVEGGYSSIRCMREFLMERDQHLQTLINTCEEFLR